jgi:hypothetical protein
MRRGEEEASITFLFIGALYQKLVQDESLRQATKIVL